MPASGRDWGAATRTNGSQPTASRGARRARELSSSISKLVV